MPALTVGYTSSAYPWRRNILDAAGGARYRRVVHPRQVPALCCSVLNRLSGGRCPAAADLRLELGDPQVPAVDLLHLFNMVSFGRTPWVGSFETVLPRRVRLLACHHGPAPDFGRAAVDPGARRAVRALAGPACRRLIALSQCTAEMQRALLATFPDNAAEIGAKLEVLHPPQAPLVDRCLPLRGRVQFLFVGAQFFRKGGLAMLEAFQRARLRHGDAFELTIVSRLAAGGYAADEGPAERRRAARLIEEGRAWIRHHPELPHGAVLERMRSAHVGLLPTHADTYGYVVLEFQAAGCPVVSTDVRALPEINDDERGWLLSLPRNRLGEALHTTSEDRRRIHELLVDGIGRVIDEILHRPDIVAEKGARALAAIRERHAPARFAEALERIYHAAIEG